MQNCDCLVNVGGEVRTEVPKTGVTPAEIAVLRHIHGNDAVTNIQKRKMGKRAHKDELQRLKDAYGKEAVDTIFGTGFNIRLPVKLEEIGPVGEDIEDETDEDDGDGDKGEGGEK